MILTNIGTIYSANGSLVYTLLCKINPKMIIKSGSEGLRRSGLRPGSRYDCEIRTYLENVQLEFVAPKIEAAKTSHNSGQVNFAC